jgi:hypothetical protein
VDDRGFYLNGIVDEVAFYPRGLGASEIAYIYKLGSTRTQTTKTVVIPLF